MTKLTEQVADSVTSTNVKVIGEAPAMAMSAMQQSVAHSTGILFENSVLQQQQIAQQHATATEGVGQDDSVGTAAAKSAAEIRDRAKGT